MRLTTSPRILLKILTLVGAIALAACGKSTEFEFTLDYSDAGPEKITAASQFDLLSNVAGGDSTWSAFTIEAKKNCGGSTPKTVEIQRIALNMVSNRGVEDLGEVFSTDVTVYMTSQGGGPGAIQTTLGTRSGLSGKGPILFRVVDFSTLKNVVQDIVNGSFILGIRGDTTRSPSDDFAVKLRITLTLVARC